MIEFTSLPNASGIYALVAPSGKQYIGSSANIRARMRGHNCAIRTGKHTNTNIKRALAKYGTLEAKVVLLCRKEDLLFYEQICIDALKPEYNHTMIAGRVEMTPEVRRKLSEGKKGRPLSPDNKNNLKGVKRSEEARKRISEVHIGIRHTDDSKAKIKATLKARGLSEEHKAKIAAASKARTGWKHTDEAKAKMRAWRHGQ